MNIDIACMTAHKIFGPKGIGAMYLNRSKVRLDPLIIGGGQEYGLRAGTLPPHLVVGFGETCRLAKLEMEHDNKWVKNLATRFLQGMQNFTKYGPYYVMNLWQ